MLAAWRVVQSVPVSEPSDPKRSPGLLLAAEDVDNESRLRNGVGPPPLTPDKGKREERGKTWVDVRKILGQAH